MVSSSDKNQFLPQENLIPLVRCPDVVLVADTPKGRGVFATRNIPARTIIDVSPVLVLDPDENEQHVKHTRFFFYTYNWPLLPPPPPSPSTPSSSSTSPSPSHPPPTQTQTQALPLGLGALFNHSTHHQNIGWSRNVSAQTITYIALRDLHEGEELCISYGEAGRLGFEDADGEVGEAEGGLEGLVLGLDAEGEEDE